MIVKTLLQSAGSNGCGIARAAYIAVRKHGGVFDAFDVAASGQGATISVQSEGRPEANIAMGEDLDRCFPARAAEYLGPCTPLLGITAIQDQEPDMPLKDPLERVLWAAQNNGISEFARLLVEQKGGQQKIIRVDVPIGYIERIQSYRGDPSLGEVYQELEGKVDWRNITSSFEVWMKLPLSIRWKYMPVNQHWMQFGKDVRALLRPAGFSVDLQRLPGINGSSLDAPSAPTSGLPGKSPNTVDAIRRRTA